MASIPPDSAGLSSVAKSQVRSVIGSFYNDLPENRTERQRTTAAAAREICEFDRNQTTISAKELQSDGDTSAKLARRARFSAEIVNERLNGEVPAAKFQQVEEKTKAAAKYTPLLGSYNRLSDAACRLTANQSEANFERFYVATMIFGVDTILVATGTFYAPAFRTTGFATNQARRIGLYRLRYLCGNRCFALGMSELHYALRAQMLGAVNYFVTTTGEMAVNIEPSDIDWRAVAQDQNIDPEVFLSSSALKGVATDVQNCTDTGTDAIQNATNESGGDSNDFGLGDIQNKSEQVINQSKSTVEGCRGD